MTDRISSVFQQASAGDLYACSIIPDYQPEEFFETHNPYNGQSIGRVEKGNAATVDAAVAVARDSFKQGQWAKLAAEERKAILLRWVALLRANAEELAALDCIDAGKPITECLNTDIPEAINTIAWYAEAIDKIFGQIAPSPDDVMALITHEPIGVTAAVLPWNFPALMFAWKAGPALAAGNAMIIKPAEQTSLSAYRMTQLAHEAGVPESVLMLVTGFGEDVGQPLGLHPDVDMVSFTGSTEVGRLFLQYSAQSNLKNIMLECGGKSPQVIFEDAYALESIADDVLAAAFWNMGENCSCGSRLIVHSRIKDKLLSILQGRLPEWRVGDPTDPETLIGPMIGKGHFEKVSRFLDSAKNEGAQLVVGGNTPAMGAGLTVEPTIFDAVTPDMAIFKEEIFGPVLAVTTFETEEQAIALANQTHYGLAASIYTSDVRRAHRVAKAIQAGNVSVNCFSEGNLATPFGGYKHSGFGGREKGLDSFRQYLETKTIWYANG